MSYLSNALVRVAEQHRLIQADLARHTGLSRAHISRVFSGESKDLSDLHFGAMLKVFAADPRAQAELVVARCMDARTEDGAGLVEIRARNQSPAADTHPELPEHIHLSRETEKAFAWLRAQCPLNPELEKHLVGYARMLGMR